MPIIDSAAFSGTENVSDQLRCDVCIIGSGPAGLTIARELANSPLKITVLESGTTHRQKETDALNEIESIGWPRHMDQWLVRNRIVGGSSSTWTGRCAPFNEVDLQLRDWVPFSGWPFDADLLRPYLERSAAYLGLSRVSGQESDEIWPRVGHKPRLRPDPDRLLPMFWQYSRDPVKRYDKVRFGRHLDSDLSSSVLVVTNATALSVNATENGRAVQSVEFASIDGRRWVLPVPALILCAGAIENARILLSSTNATIDGLGNREGLVGRFLMDHPRGTVARFRIEQARTVIGALGMFRSRRDGANLYQYGMRLSPQLQRSEGLLNCAIWIGQHEAVDDPWDSLTRFLRREAVVSRDLPAMVRNAGFLIRGINEHLISHRGLPRKLDALTLDAMTEQVPDPGSRVVLADRRDHLGMRLSRIDWHISEEEGRAMRRIAYLMAEHTSAIGIERPVLEDWVRDGAMLPDTIRDAAHPSGTTRMASDPKRGVVDSNCEVHGIRGLFVAGSSVFPTSGHANPTQMIVALSLRLADTLRARLPVRT